jgi:excisionase family DNA binding protein
VKAGGKSRGERNAEAIRELRSKIGDAAVQAILDDPKRQMTIEEAALFLGTTKGELYNLTYRRAIPFVRLGKRGVRFRRIDLIKWQEKRLQPAAG